MNNSVRIIPGPEQIKLTCRDCSLTELCLPRGLAAEEIEAFEKVVTSRPPLTRGSALYNAGEPCSNLFAVKSGSLKSVLSSVDGEEQVVGFHLPGELIGLDGLYDERHACHAIALERTTVCAIPFERLKEFMRTYPSLQNVMVQFVGGEITQDQSMLLLLAKRNAEQRLATFLLDMSRRRALRGLSTTQFGLSMSRYDIANYLGLAPETVSRLLGRFQEEELLTIDRRELNLHRLTELGGMAGWTDVLPDGSTNPLKRTV